MYITEIGKWTYTSFDKTQEILDITYVEDKMN